MKLSTPTATLSNIPKRDFSRLAKIVQKDPVMLAKIEKLHAGIKTDIRKRNTPSRRILEAMTHEQLAEKCETTPTSLSRFLSKHKIAGDVVVGKRIAYSKSLAEKIAEAVCFNANAVFASICALDFRESSPEVAADSDRIALENRAERDRILATLPKLP
jgi:hypothetical protein